MNRDPQVSVVLPTRNRAPMLRRALASVLAQEGVELEVLVVDDGSTDSTSQFLQAQSDPRIVPIHHQLPTGVARSRNDGMELARGSWIAYLDDDDLWSPRKLRTQLALTAPDVALVFCGVLFINETGRVLHERLPSADHDVRAGLKSWNIVGGPSSVLARGDLIRKAAGFDEKFSIFADWDLWLRLAQHGRVVGAVEALVAYLLHPANMHAGATEPLVRELDALQAKHPGLEIDRRSFARWLAGGQRRSGRRLAAARTYLDSGIRDRDPGNLARSALTLVAEPLMGSVRRLYERPPGVETDWLQHLLR